MSTIVFVTGYTSAQLQKMADTKGISVDEVVRQLPPNTIQRFAIECPLTIYEATGECREVSLDDWFPFENN